MRVLFLLALAGLLPDGLRCGQQFRLVVTAPVKPECSERPSGRGAHGPRGRPPIGQEG